MESESESECYSYKELKFRDGILDPSVDMTYILTMDNSINRHRNIARQLAKMVPTSKVTVIFNKGYKECDKYNVCGKITTSYEDLTHAVMHILIWQIVKIRTEF